MANNKQQMKRNIQNEKRRLANASFKSSLKTAIKNVETVVKTGDKEKAVEALNLAYKKIDKSVAKGIHHKNYANRQKSRLSNKVNAL
ncbi:MAG: 30S ribosomal protein S20 [Candidatus Izemoplasmatales bacterium]|jgi:small subunit ribosomal protein S20|nr:30S ribosomal protein S20 [Candidatus Izemoplasmatales bacterium]MDD4069412.1 30S ribosomal protein S20 [Candidatus Izemoplasmatales bacterium]MDY0138760.1 30S ribosomal protein S20 [Candidatus Izemoplasmatales bacterium]